MFDGGMAIFASRNEALRTVVAEAVENELRAGRPFTALDISNGLKLRAFAVRHGEVAPLVRELHGRGALKAYGYDRELIEVNTERGTLSTQAFLYLHDDALPSDYAGRVQDALPPVADEQARDLLAYVPVFTPTLWNAAPGAPTGRGRGRRGGNGIGKRNPRGRRRDGALPIPKRLAAAAGWRIGDVLTLTDEGNGCLRLIPAAAGSGDGIAVRVWADLRVRVAKTKLRRAALSAAFDALALEADGAGVRVRVAAG